MEEVYPLLQQRVLAQISPPEMGKVAQLEAIRSSKSNVGQDQIHDLLFGEKLSWQAIIYDLINTEQLNPWDLDLVLLTNKFMLRLREMEKMNFFVSSKVLLAASLLLRIKSEILLNEYIPSLDEILFGNNEEKEPDRQERLELEDDVPELVPRTPLPRSRKVSLKELVASLEKAIKTENRRIRKVVVSKQQEIETSLSMPKKKINLKDSIVDLYSHIKNNYFDQKKHKIAFSDLSGESREEKIQTFVPLLHLDNQKKLWLSQDDHFQEIWVWMKEHYDQLYGNTLASQFEDLVASEESSEEMPMDSDFEQE